MYLGIWEVEKLLKVLSKITKFIQVAGLPQLLIPEEEPSFQTSEGLVSVLWNSIFFSRIPFLAYINGHGD